MMHQSTTAFLLAALASTALTSPSPSPSPPTTTTTLTVRQNQDFGDNEQNGLQTGNCAANIIIFARGTTEQGNVGALAGPPFFEAMADEVGAENLAVQGVDYPADVAGFLDGGDAEGSQLMADLTTQAVTNCPGSKVVMSGYSQGGQLVHNAAELMDSAAISQVAGAVIFGDPNNGQAVAGLSEDQTLVICNNGDNICDGGTLILLPHLTYGQDAEEAAAFAAGL